MTFVKMGGVAVLCRYVPLFASYVRLASPIFRGVGVRLSLEFTTEAATRLVAHRVAKVVAFRYAQTAY